VIPVFQDNFEVGQGNCFAACIASILELPLDAVPNFCMDHLDADGSTWLERTCAWLKERGWGVLLFNWDAPVCPLDCWLICSGKSPRAVDAGDDWMHAVVCRSEVIERVDNGETWTHRWQATMVHDPHPSGAFLAGDPVDVLVLCKGVTL
jgi:hypothetical protein